MRRRRACTVLLLAFFMSLATYASAQPIIGKFRAFTTRELTNHMHYCSACYPEVLRAAYCHRLSLGKYFRFVCKRSGDTTCIASSTVSVDGAFTQLTSAVPVLALGGGGGGGGAPISRRFRNDSTAANAALAVAGRQALATARPGLKDSLVCTAFGTIFVTRDDATLGNLEDAELVSKGLEAEVVFEMAAAFEADGVAVSDSNVETISDKARPSGTEPGGPALRMVVDGRIVGGGKDALNGSSASYAARPAGLLDGEDYFQLPDIAARAVVEGVWTVDEMGSALMGGVGVDIAPVVRRFRPLPQATRIRIWFSRPVAAGRVRQIFRMILRRDRALRVYRQGFRVVQRGRQVFDLYAFFSESYRKVYRSIRRRLGRRP